MRKGITILTAIVFAVLALTEAASAYYSPAKGRFLARDPIGEEGGLNLGAFAFNAPDNLIDPLGRAVGLRRDGEKVFAVWEEMRGSLGGIYRVPREAEVGTAVTLPGGMPGVRTTSGITVSYDQAEYWVQTSGGFSDAQWRNYVTKHDAKAKCGGDCTEAVEAVLVQITTFYSSQSPDRQACLCSRVFDFMAPRQVGKQKWQNLPNIDLSRSWDINQLYDYSSKGGSFREPSRSVSVSGRCYDGSAVNYVMYGHMGKLCGRNIDEVWRMIANWKMFRYGHAPDKETEAWARAGHAGWTRSAPVYSFTPYQVPANNRVLFGKGYFTFTWEPYMYHGQEEKN